MENKLAGMHRKMCIVHIFLCIPAGLFSINAPRML